MTSKSCCSGRITGSTDHEYTHPDVCVPCKADRNFKLATAITHVVGRSSHARQRAARSAARLLATATHDQQLFGTTPLSSRVSLSRACRPRLVRCPALGWAVSIRSSSCGLRLDSRPSSRGRGSRCTRNCARPVRRCRYRQGWGRRAAAGRRCSCQRGGPGTLVSRRGGGRSGAASRHRAAHLSKAAIQLRQRALAPPLRHRVCHDGGRAPEGGRRNGGAGARSRQACRRRRACRARSPPGPSGGRARGATDSPVAAATAGSRGQRGHAVPCGAGKERQTQEHR